MRRLALAVAVAVGVSCLGAPQADRAPSLVGTAEVELDADAGAETAAGEEADGASDEAGGASDEADGASEEADGASDEADDASEAEEAPEPPPPPLPPGLPESLRADYELCADGVCPLAERLETGTMDLDPDPPLALALYGLACAAHSAWDCEHAARLLVSNRLGSRDFVGAIASARAACDEDAAYCDTLADLLAHAGPTQDLPGARAVRERACLRGDAFACRGLAEEDETASDAAGAERWLRQGCQVLEDEDSCRSLQRPPD